MINKSNSFITNIFFYLLLVFFSGTKLYSETVFEIQKIESLDDITSLDTNIKSKWYEIEDTLNPKEFTENYFESQLSPMTWKVITIPSTYKRENVKNNFIWIAKSIYLNSGHHANSISLRLGIINDRDKVYFNGELIGQTGEFGSSTPQAYDKVRIYEIPQRLLRLDNENIILIQIESFFEGEMGIAQDKTEIGPSKEIGKLFYKDEYIKLILLMMYFTVGIYFLFLYIRRRKETENLYFSMFTLLLVVYQFFRNQLKYEFDFSFVYMKKMEYLIIYIITPLFTHFIRSYFRFAWNLILKIADSIILIILLYSLLITDIKHYNFLNINIIQPLWLVYISMIIYFLVKKIRENNRDAILILVGMSFIVFGTVTDSLSTRGIIVFPRILGYLFIFFIMSLAVILANKFVQLNQEIEELNEGLEKKVIARTEELSKTLQEVQKLKTAQDGDYFLTSLLIKPLGRNRAKKDSVNIDFVLKQKKTFQFKQKESDLGGDLCRSENIRLNGKDMIVFFNADAMGKSMQGAGGAIVVGSVFDSILERTNLNESLSKEYPERWLKNSFVELHKVFESFQGSMLVSIVMGLIDSKTGLMYYINAEHPYPVLYRDEKASFLGEEVTFYKLGAEISQGFVSVNIFQLKKGDIVISGSDGRDDIMILDPKTGQKEMNYDHTLFLKKVEKSKADLSQLVEEIKNTGDITDDLSLLSIQIINDLQNGFEENLIEDVKKLLTQKNYLNALEKLEVYTDLNPVDTEALFLQSFTLKKIKRYHEAILVGERIRIRDPKNYKNIVNLSHCYSMVDNLDRASYLANLVPEGKEKEFAKKYLN
ncbi:MAG: 7TM diverse intracellular signaling domain-containing protein [Leptospiraceae bacterium]|nr:7TM diverse intracellular signaling domain-containing protein [Leptospiraceae bacterium]